MTCRVLLFGWLALSVDNGWFWVFTVMALTRLIGLVFIARVKV